jgi:hypothetical protein
MTCWWDSPSGTRTQHTPQQRSPNTARVRVYRDVVPRGDAIPCRDDVPLGGCHPPVGMASVGGWHPPSGTPYPAVCTHACVYAQCAGQYHRSVYHDLRVHELPIFLRPRVDVPLGALPVRDAPESIANTQAPVVSLEARLEKAVVRDVDTVEFLQLGEVERIQSGALPCALGSDKEIPFVIVPGPTQIGGCRATPGLHHPI